MEVFKRGTGILPVKNVRSPMKRRKESRARCPCHAISQVPILFLIRESLDGYPTSRHKGWVGDERISRVVAWESFEYE
jgi:hypothetical protein